MITSFPGLLVIGYAVACIPLACATDYFVDPSGNDSATGTSTATPWKSLAKVNATTFLPGDNICFRKGGTWYGTLWPKGSGNNTSQINLTSYGTGAKPLIDGAGGSAAISLSGQSYWTIDGFEATNFANGTGGNRCGIRIGGGGDGSTITRIRILNNDVHDIQATPNVEDGARNWGGIYLWIDEPGKANDVLIQGNTVTEVQGQGITFWGEWENAGGGMNYANCSPNVVVRGNRVWRTSGDGILTLGTDNELVEYNEVAYAGALSGNGNNIAAAWPTRHINGVWQYNHVHHTKWLNANDSTAFDNDGFVSGTTIFQYNVTHDNEGGFIMEYTWGGDVNARTIARYNISWNDKRIIATNRNNALLHNNVFYNPGATLDVNWTPNPSGVQFYNNLFVAAGRSAEFSRQIFVNNNFSGTMGRPVTTNGNVTTDPLFVSPNTSGNLAGFILQSTSAARNSGSIISGNGGKDFWGVTLPATAPHRGASQINVIDDYTATPTYLTATGPFTATIPASGSTTLAFTAALRDQKFHFISSPAITWSLSPAASGYAIDSNGVVTISSTAQPQRIAVVATSGSLTATSSFGATAQPRIWDNGAGTGTWNATDVNWSGAIWSDGTSAVFSHTANPQTVTLDGARSADALRVGNGTNNADYTFTSAAGSSLSAVSFALQGSGANDATTAPGTTFTNAAISVAGNLGIGRARLSIGGSSVIEAGTIGGGGIADSPDWGYLTLSGSANVTAATGVIGNTTAWGINLNGGTLTTKSINASDFNYLGAYLYFNGTTVRATESNPAFVSLFNGTKAYIGTGGAIIDTNGHDIGIGIILTDASSASPAANGGTTLSGSGSLTKKGSGILNLSQGPSISGEIALTAGRLKIGGADWAINNELHLSNGTMEIGGWGGKAIQSGKSITFDAPGGGVLNLTAVNFYPANWGSQQSIFSTGGAQNQITGGQNGGINLNGNTLNFNVTRGSDPVSDLIMISNFWNSGTLVKSGDGILELTAANSAGNTTISAGTLRITGSGTPGSGAVTNNAALVFNRSADLTVPNQISGGGTLTQSGTGSTIRLSEANSYTGVTAVEGGTLVLQNTYASSSFVISSGTTLELNVAGGSRDLASTTFSGTGTLTKTGAGGVIWGAGGATFALGAGSWIDVQAGSFTAGSYANENWSGNLSGLIVASGASFGGVEANIRVDALTGAGTISSGYGGAGYVNFTFGVNNGSGTFSGNLTDGAAAGNFVKAGTGTQTLSATNSYSGTTTVSGGTLILGNGTTNTSLANSADVIVNTGCTLQLNYTGTDIIDELWLGGLQKSPGVYGATNSSGFLSGTGTLTVQNGPPASGFENWISTNYPTLADSSAAADPDSDGISNIIEYVLNGNPGASSTDILPTVSTNEPANILFTFTRREESAHDTTQIFQYGSSLTAWTDIPITAPPGAEVTLGTPALGLQPVTIRIPKSSAPSGRLFGRLKVSAPPAQQ